MEGKAGGLLTLRQVAEKLNVSMRTIHRRIGEGVFPAPIKVGRCSRFCPEDVALYMERCKSRRARL